MLKVLRKHNKWIMVVFGGLLMLTFLVPQTIQQLGSGGENTTVAKIDGRKITAKQMQTANREIVALSQIAPFLLAEFQMDDRDPHHWLLLAHEAERAGLVGGPEDGRLFLDRFARASLMRDPRFMQMAGQIADPDQQRKFIDDSLARFADQVKRVFVEGGKQTEQDILQSLARASGVLRLVNGYNLAPRFSDRRLVLATKDRNDAVTMDYLFIDASRLADQEPAPTDAELQAHFDRFKGTKPGEGEFGIGYLLPPRVKIEFMKLDKRAIESTISLDPVEVRRRHQSDKAKYPGDFAADRARVEADMRNEAVERIMQEAQQTIQAEVLKVTRRLDIEGKYKKLSPDWATVRPRWETIAPVVVEGLKTRQNVTIPLPSVTVMADKFLTAEDLSAIPGLGQSFLRQGAITEQFASVMMWTREAGGTQGFIPVQVDIPLADTFFTDFAGNRYYVTVRAGRPESAPDSLDEIRAQLTADLRSLRAYERLKGRTAELRGKAVAGGLEAVAAEFPKAGDNGGPVQIVRAGKVTRETAANPMGQPPLVQAEPIRDAVFAAVQDVDPLTPWGAIPADKATIAVAYTKGRGVLVGRILAQAPLTKESFASGGAVFNQDLMNQNRAIRMENDRFLTVENVRQMNPFSFANMLKRHNYESNEIRIQTPEDFRREAEKNEKAGPKGQPKNAG